MNWRGLGAALAAAGMAAGVPVVSSATAAGPVHVRSIELQLNLLGFSATQLIWADVHGYFPKVVIPPALPANSVEDVVRAGADPVECSAISADTWQCSELDPTGYIRITYLSDGTALSPGAYTVSMSMGEDGVTYAGSGTVTLVGAATAPPAPATSNPSAAQSSISPAAESTASASPTTVDSSATASPALAYSWEGGGTDPRILLALVLCPAAGIAAVLAVGFTAWWRARRRWDDPAV